MKKVTYDNILNKKQNNTWMLINMKFISRVDEDIFVTTRNNFIFSHIHLLFPIKLLMIGIII